MAAESPCAGCRSRPSAARRPFRVAAGSAPPQVSSCSPPIRIMHLQQFRTQTRTGALCRTNLDVATCKAVQGLQEMLISTEHSVYEVSHAPEILCAALQDAAVV